MRPPFFKPLSVFVFLYGRLTVDLYGFVVRLDVLKSRNIT